MCFNNIKCFLIVLTFFSCKSKKNQHLEKDIIGEWKFIETKDSRKYNLKNNFYTLALGEKNSGFIFYEDKKCENKLGYFKQIESIEPKDRLIIYLGNTTQYKLENDSLKIFDLSVSTWQSSKIFSIDGDILTIQIRDGLFEKFARTHYKLNSEETYDKIIVSSSGCLGFCPIMDVSLDKSGEVLFFGERYNTKNGFFSSKITKEEFQNITSNFNKADIQSLSDTYGANFSDHEMISITFIKDNKIVKSITDYGKQSPSELIWAYTPIRFLYQQLTLSPVKKDQQSLIMRGITFEKGQNICHFSEAESFYLLTELRACLKIILRQ